MSLVFRVVTCLCDDECGEECEGCDIVSMIIVSCVNEYLNETT